MDMVELYEAGAAAERLGVSASGLRRYATIYEARYGPLPRKPKTQNRLYPGEAVERLAGAKSLVESGRSKGIAEALEALERGEEPDAELVNTGGGVSRDLEAGAAEALLEEFRAMRRELVELRAEVRELRSLPPADRVSGDQPGLLVRLATRAESWLRGRG